MLAVGNARRRARGAPKCARSVWTLVLGLAVAGAAHTQESPAPSSDGAPRAAGDRAAPAVPLAPSAEDVPSSPLAEAAMRGDIETLRRLLDEGSVDFDAPGRTGTPALHWLIHRGDRDAALRLIAAGADVNAANRYGVAPLHVAIETGDAILARRLLEAGADAGAADRTGELPLMLAARVGEPAITDALLEHGADVDAREPHFGQTALMIAVREGHFEVAERLLDAGADANARTRPEEPPRFIPPSESPEGLSKGSGIIRAGWPEGRGKRFPAGGSKTPLLYATRHGHLEITRLLLSHGAELELAEGNGITPLINAIVNASSVRLSPTGKTDHLAIAHLLLDAGADPNAMDWYGQTPLWAAVDMRNLELGPRNNDRNVRDEAFVLIERLLELGADPNARTREFPHERRFIVEIVGSVAWVDLTGQTPFLRAAAAGDLDVMRLLLAFGADPNIPTYAGTTPLMVAAGVNWAVDETYTESPEALLEAVQLAHSLGNDVNAVNSMGIAAIHGAANRGANDVIEYLAANGARLDVADAQGRTPMDWAEGVFLATHPPVRRPETIALLERLQRER
ncbi:MAG: ankyrin repeat domain-containing protein [Gammaproteobacteria bacterium]|nr:ankyrin repeat domain-containing protein [Gammaproteobacteria bacterium]